MKKIIFSILFFTFALTATAAFAQIVGSSSGWLWGGSDDGFGNATGVGWISMNSSNCDPNGDGITEGGADNGVYPNCTSGQPIASYSAAIPSTSGNVAGYAWSENIGWIDFDPVGPYPGVPNNSVQRIGDILSGWARVVAIKDAGLAGNSGGWNGWIKMSSEAGAPVPYGVTINSDQTMAGSAWNGEDLVGGIIHGLGWIDFSRAVIAQPLKICSDTSLPCDGGASVLSSQTLNVGQSVQVRACEVAPSEPSSSCVGTDRTNASTWTSGDGTIATVVAGVITGQSNGSTPIAANYSGLADTLPVTVVQTTTCWVCDVNVCKSTVSVGSSCRGGKWATENECNASCGDTGRYREVAP